jgi:hypothetical protein
MVPSAKYLASKSGQIFLLANRETGLLAQETTAGRLFGLDAGDWSMLLLGLALACVLVVLI